MDAITAWLGLISAVQIWQSTIKCQHLVHTKMPALHGMATIFHQALSSGHSQMIRSARAHAPPHSATTSDGLTDGKLFSTSATAVALQAQQRASQLLIIFDNLNNWYCRVVSRHSKPLSCIRAGSAMWCRSRKRSTATK